LDRIRICEKNVDREIARVKPYTRHTTVDDIEGYVDKKYNLTHLAGAFPSLDTLRVLVDRENHSYMCYYPFPCKTLILFDDCGDHGYEPNGMLQGTHQDCLPNNVWSYLPEEGTKVVLNLNSVPAAPRVLWEGYYIGGYTYGINLIIYANYTLCGANGFVGFDEDFPTKLTSPLLQDPKFHCTFVGLEECATSKDYDIRRLLRDLFISWEEPEECINDAMDKITVLTKHEYAKRVKDIELETVQYFECDVEED
jgi:hypothetical protein